jgi:hypothetical protein
MKQRVLASVLLFCVALAVLLLRYRPPQGRIDELGDPLDSQLLTGFYLPEYLGDLAVRRTLGDATLRLPLADRRGAQTVSLRLRSGTRAPISLRLDVGATLVTSAPPALRTFHLLTPPHPSRQLDLALQALPADRGPLNLLVDQVVVRSRAGWPPALDLLALAAIALIPALLLALAARLPFDWALVPGVLLIALLALLPAADRPALLRFGPLVALVIAGVALLPPARAYPAITLLTLGGAALRCYALGWGGGLIMHPDEQALVDRSATGWIEPMLHQTAQLAALISGRSAWRDPWGVVLIGRAWAALSGSLLIVAVYLLGRQLFSHKGGQRWALLAAAYVAATPLLVQQSHGAPQPQLDALLVVLLMLSHTYAARGLGAIWLSVGAGLALLLAAAYPEGWPLALALLLAPLLAQPTVWRLLRHRGAQPRSCWLVIASCLLALLGGAALAYWSVSALTVRSLAPARAADEASGQLTALPGVIADTSSRRAALLASFTVMTWGLGPLLVQLGLVGWGAGVFASMRARKPLWRPLLVGMGAYGALVGLGAADTPSAVLPGAPTAAASLRSLTPLTPLLALTAALLLQLFARRLRDRIGRRTVRLLSGTALCLALAVVLGMLHIYRLPDTRVTASRWLIAHVRPGQIVLQDASLRQPLPLNLDHLVASVRLPRAAADSALDDAIAALRQADYIVLAVERSDLDLARIAQSDPLTACYYSALFDGRLGFTTRASFSVTPNVAAWTIDDSRADPRLRLYDHPPVRIFQRVAAPTPDALELILRCAAPAR